MSLWMIRAGKHGEDEETCLEQGLAIIGYKNIPDLSAINLREDIIAILVENLPDKNENALKNFSAQLHAFVRKMQQGDLVVLPLKTRPYVALGIIVGPYKYIEVNGEKRHTRKVKWEQTEILRTTFGQDMLYSLGAFSTVCEIKRNDAEERFKTIMKGKADPGKKILDMADSEAVEEPGAFMTNIEQMARDQLMNYLEEKFKEHNLERLINAVLQAEGFTTDLVKPGPDGGVDILAGKGDLGFGSPRICVQVKSSKDPAEVTVLRSLQGVLDTFKADYGLLVSWSGFTSSVTKEARQHYFKIRLWDADEILSAIQRNYDRFPEELQQELPMKRMWLLVQDEQE